MSSDEPLTHQPGASAAIILAAGRGVRMRSRLPKVLHPIAGIPMLLRVVEAVRQSGVTQIIVVLGHEADTVRAMLPPGVTVAIQPEPRGTGDAVAAAMPFLAPAIHLVLVVGGDTPLVTPETLRSVQAELAHTPVAMVAANLDNPHGYGRVVLGSGNAVDRIVEEADASPEERAGTFVNGMIFGFAAAWLRSALPTVQQSAGGEIYLTALVAYAAHEGQPAHVVHALDSCEIVGVNTRAQLATTEAAARTRVLRRLMDEGVTIVDPGSTYVDEGVQVAPDVVIHPQSYLRGRTVVERDCIIGPGAEIIDSHLGEQARVWWSVVEGADVGPRVRIGPYFRVRAGAILEADVALGSFGEVKNSRLGARTQMHHFSYLGDAVVGPDVNIGAGAITCNYDGENKHQTTIGEGVFVGSDSLLIAPVTLGAGSMTGAGSVVTRDVAPGARVVGMPARPIGPKRKTQPAPDAERTHE